MKFTNRGQRAVLRGLSVSALACLALCPPASTLASTSPRGAHIQQSSPCGRLTTAPAYKHVIVIMDENQTYSSIIGSSKAPYINSLASECGLASNYHSITHDSLPNYLGITSGLPLSSLLPFDADCVPSAKCEVTTGSIFRQAGSWKDYAESMPSNCYKKISSYYAPKHNPSVYYTDLTRCNKRDVPLGTTSDSPLLQDFSSESTAPAFSYVTGNLCDDMHGATGCTTNLIQAGDTWLSTWIPLITSSAVYQDGDTVIFLVWDEGPAGPEGERCYDNTTDPSCHVPAIVIAPSVRPGTVSSTEFSHYSLLRTAEDLLGLKPLGMAKSATPMESDFNL
jgi:hypothetical protein